MARALKARNGQPFVGSNPTPAAESDGVLKLTVDSYAKKAGWNVRRSLTGLTDRVHTVTVKVTGTKRRASTGTTVAVDRWLVG